MGAEPLVLRERDRTRAHAPLCWLRCVAFCPRHFSYIKIHYWFPLISTRKWNTSFLALDCSVGFRSFKYLIAQSIIVQLISVSLHCTSEQREENRSLIPLSIQRDNVSLIRNAVANCLFFSLSQWKHGARITHNHLSSFYLTRVKFHCQAYFPV